MVAFAAIAVLLLAAALLFVLPPLGRGPGTAGLAADQLALRVLREQRAELDAALAAGRIGAAEHAAERDALAQRALAEAQPAAVGEGAAAPRGLRVGLALAVPAAALALYVGFGRPATLQPPADVAATAEAPHALGNEQVLAMVQRLAERLQRQPDDGDGWHMLARSQLALGHPQEAARAYERAVALLPQQPALLADAADALALVNGRQLEGRPLALVQAALALDPRQPKALALAGTAAFNRRDFAQAIEHWERLLALQAPGSEGAQRIAASLAQARSQLPGAAAPAAAGVPARVAGLVQLAPALQARLAGGETLYIFARAVNGPRMPLAIVRQAAGRFPVAFELGDAQAVQPGLRLSSQAEVMLGARLSRSGNATPQSGDLMGTLGPVKLGSDGVQLLIDGVVP